MARIPLAISSGLATVVSSTRSRTTGRASAAMRPAKPLRSGMRTPWRTSSSMPRAAVAISADRIGVQEEDRRGVDLEDVAQTVQQLVEQVLDVEVGQGGVGQSLDLPEPLGGVQYTGVPSRPVHRRPLPAQTMSMTPSRPTASMTRRTMPLTLRRDMVAPASVIAW